MARRRPIQEIAERMPGSEEARDESLRSTQLQETAARAPRATRRATQDIGAGMAGQAAKDRIAARQRQIQRESDVRSLQLQEQQRNQAKEIAERQIALQKKNRDLQNRLAQTSREMKSEIFDRQMSFRKDELNRTHYNQRQLLDWKVTQAKNIEELQDYEQTVQQLHSRKMKMLQVSQEKIRQTLEQGYLEGKQKLDNQTKLKLLRAKRAIEEKIRRENARARNTASMVSAIGAIGGGIIGGIATGGTPMGIAAGAQMGSGVATAGYAATQ